ncbi:MAG: PQQ-dependent sugar dehydrogenase [Pseudomonadota bacterium]
MKDRVATDRMVLGSVLMVSAGVACLWTQDEEVKGWPGGSGGASGGVAAQGGGSGGKIAAGGTAGTPSAGGGGFTGGAGGTGGSGGSPSGMGGTFDGGAAGETAGDAGAGGAAEAGAAGMGAEAGAGGAGDAGAAGAGGDDGAALVPELRPISAERVDQLTVPDGFSVSVFAQNLGMARMLATYGDFVYVTRPTPGDVLRLEDTNGDGVADSRVTVAADLPLVHGIAFLDSDVYLVTENVVYRGTVDDDGNFSELTPIIDDLPDGGLHPLRTIGIGPDERLYVAVGSNCDACVQNDSEQATILRAPLDGATRTIFASGLRNTLGFDWHPDTGELWGMDNGTDSLANAPDELNHIEEGNAYGWPYCFGDRLVDPQVPNPPGTTKLAYCAMTTPPVLETEPHSVPTALVFYTGDSFPEDYRGDAFATLHGSTDRVPPSGFEVIRIRFEDGQPVAIEPFVSGFVIEQGQAQFGRPTGLTVASDGALLFSDDANGAIYRVTYAP